MSDELRQPELPQNTPVVIDSFRGDFGFMSNFHEASIWIDGQRYPSVEHAYQAFKFGPYAGEHSAHDMVRTAKSPGMAKKLGYSAQLPADWDATKTDLMRRLVREKFKNPLLRSMLVATEDVTLIEGNTWNDRFWGVCKGTGQNWLGRILMEVREECKREE
jgi:N-glycosidase YbiA